MNPDPKKIHIKKDLPKCRVTNCQKKGDFENGICDKCKIALNKGIPKESEKRKEQNKLYLILRKQFLKDNPICIVTGEKATEIHHTYCGANRSKYLLDITTWLAVSRNGHNWIHDNPLQAKEKEFLKYV